MSTILDALRKLQRERDAAKRPDLDLRGSVVAPESGEGTSPHRSLHWMLLLGVTAGMATGALLLYAYGWPRTGGDAEERAASVNEAPAPSSLPSTAPTLGDDERTLAASDGVMPGVLPSADRAPFATPPPSGSSAFDEPTRPQTPSELRRARRAASSPAVAPQVAPPSPPPAADRAPIDEPIAAVRERPPAAAQPSPLPSPAAEPRPTVVGPAPSPPIRVDHIRWHPDPARREVSLELEDVRIPNAREGDIVSGVLVRRIDPDSVEIQIGSARKRVPLAP
jgi:hypothetical protein